MIEEIHIERMERVVCWLVGVGTRRFDFFPNVCASFDVHAFQYRNAHNARNDDGDVYRLHHYFHIFRSFHSII